MVFFLPSLFHLFIGFPLIIQFVSQMVNSFNILKEVLADQNWAKVNFNKELGRIKEKWEKAEETLSAIEIRLDTIT